MDAATLRCERHDQELTELKINFRNSYTEMRGLIADMKAITATMQEQRLATTRIEASMATACADVSEIKATLKADVAGREEFVVLRNQVWGVIGVIVTSFITALFYIVTRTAMILPKG